MIDKEWRKDLHHKTYTPICDNCGEILPTVDDYIEAVEAMRKVGWESWQDADGEWHNLCKHC